MLQKIMYCKRDSIVLQPLRSRSVFLNVSELPQSGIIRIVQFNLGSTVCMRCA